MISNGISKLDLKRRNRSQILRLLRRCGPTSRIDIARDIGITKAAVTIITNEMIEEGILYEKGEQHCPGGPVSRGRKKILLDICATYKMDLGIVLEGNYIHAGVSTLWGEIVEKQLVPIAPGASREEILTQLEGVYQQLLYKNGLTPERITGLGICIDPIYYHRLEIVEVPFLDASRFVERLSNFVQVPIIYGRLTDATAIAEAEYWQRDQEEPADNMLLFRCSGSMNGAVIIEQELYRGAHGKVLQIPEMQIARAEENFWNRLNAEFSEENTPVVWNLTQGNSQRMKSLARDGALPLEDEPFRRIAEGFAAQRAEEIRYAASFFDPDRIFLLAAGERENWLRDYLEQNLGDLSIRRSKIQPDTLFLAGAALATREFFCNKGGY